MGIWKLLMGRERVVVVDRKSDAPPDMPFRLRNDEAHVVRFAQDWPEGISAYIASDIPVAGVSKGKAKRVLAKFLAGESRSVRLRRDPSNKFDPNAIAVIGTWRKGKIREGQLGWVPAEVAAEIALEYPNTVIGARLRTIFKPRSGLSAGLRIDVGRPRASRSRR